MREMTKLLKYPLQSITQSIYLPNKSCFHNENYRTIRTILYLDSFTVILFNSTVSVTANFPVNLFFSSKIFVEF